jgi:hypothetical protein
MSDASRAFARRFQERHPKRLMPNDMQAGVYSGVLHYLKAARWAALPTARPRQATIKFE